MATFEEHLSQAKKNLEFLQHTNSTTNNFIDWQVTICFYTAVHIVNAHLSRFGQQYRSHTDVKFALNPVNMLSPTKLPEDIYTSFITLQMLSRRSRYLVNEKDNKLNEGTAAFTSDKHLAKAIKHLDNIIHYFNDQYTLGFPIYVLKCPPEVKRGELKILAHA